MRTIIAGSRDITDYGLIVLAVECSRFKITEVVSGTARGVDVLGELWAMLNDVPVTRYPANWDAYGKSAGYMRNEEMAAYADALIAVWDGKSKGTSHMIKLAQRYKLKTHILLLDDSCPRGESLF